MTRLLAIDPGPSTSAWLVYSTAKRVPISWGIEDNETVLRDVGEGYYCSEMAIEVVASYGMAVGASTFETCEWIGRFIERWASHDYRSAPRRVYRKDVTLHLCNSAKAGDKNVRQALLDRYGSTREKAVGTKKAPGPLMGITSHVWSALAVAITAAETGENAT